MAVINERARKKPVAERMIASATLPAIAQFVVKSTIVAIVR